MSNKYFQVAQILATLTGFMFLMYSIVYSSALSLLSESNTYLLHSSDMILNSPQQLLNLNSLKTAVNDTNLTVNYSTSYLELFKEYSKMDLENAKAYADSSAKSLNLSNGVLITTSVFMGITLLISMLGFFQDFLEEKGR
jgi:hypothetical protein